MDSWHSLLHMYRWSKVPIFPTSIKVLVNSPHWLPHVRIGKSFESHTLIGRLLRPSSVSPSLHQPSVSLFADHMTSFTGHMTSFIDHMTSFTGHMTSFIDHMTPFTGHMTSFIDHMTFTGHMTSFIDHMTSFTGHMTSFIDHRPPSLVT